MSWTFELFGHTFLNFNFMMNGVNKSVFQIIVRFSPARCAAIIPSGDD